MISRFIYILAIVLIFQGCAPMTKTQVRLTRNYFETITNYTLHFRELNEQYAKIQLEYDNLRSSLQDEERDKVETIISSIDEYQRRLTLPDSVEKQIKKFDQYVQNYFVLIPQGFDAYKAIKSTSEAIGSVFGVKGLVSALFPNASLSVSSARKRKIHTHLVTYSDSVKSSAIELKRFINSHYKPSISKMNKDSEELFRDLLQNIRGRPEPLHYFQEHNRILIRYYQHINLTQRLATSLSQAVDLILTTEPEILTKIMERKKINPESINVNELLRNAQRTNSYIAKLRTINGSEDY